MKTLYAKIIVVIFLMTLTQKGFSQSVTYQFYHDLNNNCNLDAGESLLSNLPGYISVKYVNASSFTVTNMSSVTCAPLPVSSPSLPATNTCSFILSSSTNYPTYAVNMSCSSYTNLSYTGVNYLPVRKVDMMSNPNFYTNTTGFYTATPTTSTNPIGTFPICSNLVNDSANIYFNVDNIYSCSGAGAQTASRTYSVYLDNVLLDVAVVTGTAGSTTTIGSMSKATIFETYNLNTTNLYFRAKVGSGPLSLGSHLYVLKSTPIYTPALSALNYSVFLNAIPCSVVSGSFYEDCDNNCNKTSGDGTLNYGAYAILYNATNSYNVFSDVLGNFSGIVPTSTSQYSITSYSMPSFTPCPAATLTTAIVSSSGYDFGFKTSAGTYIDPQIFGPSLTGITNPGSIKNIKVFCGNYPFVTTCTSSVPANPGKVKVVLDKNFVYQNVVGTTPVPNSIAPGPSGDTLIWNLTNLNSTAFFNYTVSAQMASTVTVGTGFANYAMVLPTIDVNNANNFSVFTWTVGLPFDPNNKISWASGIQPNGDIPLTTTDLFYTINFQNVGKAPAINVKCLDTLDSNLDWNTLHVISSSFPVQVQTDMSNGQTFFNFNNINLPDSTSNSAGSHGFVHYRIKLKPSVPLNTIIKNRSYNYFDFMSPVATNQTKNKLTNTATSLFEIEKSNLVYFAPNPVTDKLTVYSKEIIQTVSVFNNLGQLILKQDVNGNQSQMDLSQLTDGIYFLNIQFKDGSRVTRKVIKN